jgi:hypothetical protein
MGLALGYWRDEEKMQRTMDEAKLASIKLRQWTGEKGIYAKLFDSHTTMRLDNDSSRIFRFSIHPNNRFIAEQPRFPLRPQVCIRRSYLPPSKTAKLPSARSWRIHLEADERGPQFFLRWVAYS